MCPHQLLPCIAPWCCYALQGARIKGSSLLIPYISHAGKWKSLDAWNRRKKSSGYMAPPSLLCQCCSGQELAARDFAGHVCSGTGFWILFSSCCFVGMWLIYFVDPIAKSDDLFRMNHWTPFIWKQLWLLLTLSWVSDWERNVLVLLLTLGPLHSSLLCVMWSYAQE